ncbi:hypothetical protein EDB89DRAFT_2177117 [Lactarius sanguifluus]|nr:hypothetical protein EDB89DRAFT_2177117 [Lactarius sanguifluus]
MDPEGKHESPESEPSYVELNLAFPSTAFKVYQLRSRPRLLAKTRSIRYRLSQQKEDLDKSILFYTTLKRSSFLSFPGLDILSMNFDQIEDVKYLVEYIRYLQGLPLESFNIPRIDVMAMPIQALGVQVKSGTGDFPVAAFTDLDQAAPAEFVRQWPIPLLDEVIECLRDAVKVCPPGSYEVCSPWPTNTIHFFKTRSNDDYEDATALWERILDPSQHGKCSDSIRLVVSSWVTILAIIRSANYQKPEYTEVAISRMRAKLGSSC